MMNIETIKKDINSIKSKKDIAEYIKMFMANKESFVNSIKELENPKKFDEKINVLYVVPYINTHLDSWLNLEIKTFKAYMEQMTIYFSTLSLAISSNEKNLKNPKLNKHLHSILLRIVNDTYYNELAEYARKHFISIP